MTVPRRVTALALFALLLVGPVPVAGTASAGVGTASEQSLHGLINDAREKEGVRLVDLRRNLTRKAHKHSRRMANQGRLFHQQSSAYPSGATWGENVAMARGVRRAHRKLMRSPAHRQNILCGCFDRVGVGVVKRNGWVWVTEMFVG